MRHAFLMNVHKDVEQAVRTCELLLKYFPNSWRIAYYDGASADLILNLRYSCSFLTTASYEPRKYSSIMNALNNTMATASQQRIDVASFLHSDMIPMDPWTFERFLDRFLRSGKMMSACAMWPGSNLLDFCNLHFNVRAAMDAGLFLIQPTDGLEGNQDFNESHFTRHLHRVFPKWRDESYELRSVVVPFTDQYKQVKDDGVQEVIAVKQTHGLEESFTFHNYTPETSVVRSNDQVFWGGYERMVR